MSEVYNFDKELGRDERADNRPVVTFVFGGQEFHARLGVGHDVLRPVGLFTPDTRFDVKLDAALEVLDGFLVPEDRERWATMTIEQKDVNPVTYEDLQEVLGWLIQEDSARPTSPSNDSAPGQSTDGTGTTSTGASVSQEAPAQTA